jgi:hypothetical protein
LTLQASIDRQHYTEAPSLFHGLEGKLDFFHKVVFFLKVTPVDCRCQNLRPVRSRALAVISALRANLERHAMGVSAIKPFACRRAILDAVSVTATGGTSPTQGMTDAPSPPERDLLEISAEARTVADAAEQPSSLKDGLPPLFDFVKPGEAVTLEDLERAQREAQGEVQQELDALLVRDGIDTSREIRLQVAGDGQVIVTNDHPERAEIERLFRDDPELRNNFVKSTSLAETVAAGREAVAFQAAYARDPYAAVAQYSRLFDATAGPTVTLSILGDQYQTLFERPGREAEAV